MIDSAESSPPEHGRRPARRQVGEPLGAARVQVRARPARRVESGARAERGGPLFRQWTGTRDLVGQRAGDRPAASAATARPRRTGSQASCPDQLRQEEPNCEVLVVPKSSSRGTLRCARDDRPHAPRPVLDDDPRATVRGRPIRLRGQVHRRIEAVRRFGARDAEESRQLLRAPRPCPPSPPGRST